MQPSKNTRVWRPFFIRIILPAIITISLFVFAIFLIIIPAFEANMLAGKREMIKELSNTAQSMISKLANQEKNGTLGLKEAQNQALLRLGDLRFGVENKDYFWLTDLSPRMLMHPFRADLIGQELSTYTDLEDRRLFIEFTDIAKTQGDGFIQYMWDDKNDSSKMVPKLSYVRLFKPWGWILGTGIYLEDVYEEIDTLTNRLIKISLAITGLIVALLLFIARESLRIETERQQNEARLRDAGEKYKTLVEASTEGVMMIMNGSIVYSNEVLEQMLGYTPAEINTMRFADIVADNFYSYPEESFDDGGAENPNLLQMETPLKQKGGSLVDCFLSASPMELGGQQGTIITIKDISAHKEVVGELGARKEKFEHLTDNINIGVFRATVGRREQFVEANPAALSIFGMNTLEELTETRIRDLFQDQAEQRLFIKTLLRDGVVKNMILSISREKGNGAIISISAVLVKDSAGIVMYCDGFVEDITDRHLKEQEREELITELQTTLLFQNEPIRRASSSIVPRCQLKTPIHIAAKSMVQAGTSAILITPEEGSSAIGIVTDNDIRERVVANKVDWQHPVASIMSAPLISISEEALVFEGILKILESNVDHLLIRDVNGSITRVISAKNLLKSQQYPLTMLLESIEQAESPTQMILVRERLPYIIQAIFLSRPDPRNFARIVSAVSEAVMKKCIDFAIEELGPPPCDFAFMAMGSVGREEQTLVTDQDNAIIYEDVQGEVAETAAKYFLTMGEMVCNWLDQAGYSLCEGDIMAKNPKWCQSISIWKKYFQSWVSALEPSDLLDSKIFFDFRGVYGQEQLVDQLRQELFDLTAQKPMFFYHLAQNCLLFKPPLSFFKNIVVESAGEHREMFSIKKAMTPVVDYTRIYALRHGIRHTNTFSRLAMLEEVGHFTKKECRELTLVYKTLLELRFKHQVLALAEGRVPDNYINPKEVTEMEQALLREALAQIADFQTKMSFEYKEG